MNKEKYFEMFKSPKWQKKRLEILKRDKWKCILCNVDSEELHVHHTGYIDGRKPWEYSNNGLVTLCDTCHKKEHEDLYEKLKAFNVALRASGFLIRDLEMIVQLMADNKDIPPNMADFKSDLFSFITTY